MACGDRASPTNGPLIGRLWLNHQTTTGQKGLGRN